MDSVDNTRLDCSSFRDFFQKVAAVEWVVGSVGKTALGCSSFRDFFQEVVAVE